MHETACSGLKEDQHANEKLIELREDRQMNAG